MGVNSFESKTSFYTTPICCPQWPKSLSKYDRSIWPLAMLQKLKTPSTIQAHNLAGSPLSPRQRYVRRQSDQDDKSGFANEREKYPLPHSKMLTCWAAWHILSEIIPVNG
jgi:hypothetical protein